MLVHRNNNNGGPNILQFVAALYCARFAAVHTMTWVSVDPTTLHIRS